MSLVLFVIVLTQGSVSGQEFSPTHFRLRNFSFYEIPLIHVQLTPIQRSGSTPQSATYVRQTSLIPVTPGAPTQWHLVQISRGLTGTTPADADLLVQQLALHVDGNAYWKQWSKDHPNRAKVLWPVIQRLAKRELYLLMPSLFELAQRDQSADQLAAALDRQLRRNYHGLIADMIAADREDVAGQLAREALSDYPRDDKLRHWAESFDKEASTEPATAR